MNLKTFILGLLIGGFFVVVAVIVWLNKILY